MSSQKPADGLAHNRFWSLITNTQLTNSRAIFEGAHFCFQNTQTGHPPFYFYLFSITHRRCQLHPILYRYSLHNVSLSLHLPPARRSHIHLTTSSCPFSMSIYGDPLTYPTLCFARAPPPPSLLPGSQHAAGKGASLTEGCPFSRMRSEGFPFIVGGLGVGAVFAWLASRRRLSSSSRLKFAAIGKLLQVTFHGCVTCQFAPLFHSDLHDTDMSRKKRDAFRCTGAAFCEIRRLLRSSIGISVWRVVFLWCWMWPCHWDLSFRVWRRSSVFVTSLS